jgi:hypothetical protein
MDNFASQSSPIPPGLPPRHKVKVDQSQSSNKNKIEDEEAQLQELLDEELPVVVDKPPQCDWHLGAMMSADYPDPFTLPAIDIGRQILAYDTAALVEAIYKDSEQKSGSENDSKDSAAQ